MEFILNNPSLPLLLVGIGVVLIILEVFTPALGAAGIIGLTLAGAGIIGLLAQGSTLTAIGSCVFVITMGLYVLKQFTFNKVQDPESYTSVDRGIAENKGKSGVTKSALRPAGVALIDGKRIDVVAVGRFIEKDKPIKVVKTSGNRVVVEEISESKNKSQESGNG